MRENFWDAQQQVTTERYFILDAASGMVTRHASSMQAYENADYSALLTDCGFTDVTFYASLAGNAAIQPQLLCIVATK